MLQFLLRILQRNTQQHTDAPSDCTYLLSSNPTDNSSQLCISLGVKLHQNWDMEKMGNKRKMSSRRLQNG